MSLLDTSQIACWPKSIYLACGEIQHQDSVEELSSQEQDDLSMLTNENRRNEFISGRKLLREAAMELQWDTSEISIHKEELGKPYGIMNGKKFFVSFTHTNGMIFCAFSEEMDLGIDAELTSRKIHEGLQKRILHQSEYAFLDTYSLIHLWTIKEAAVKRKGIGIRLDLRQVSISNGSKIIFNDDSVFHFCNFELLDHSISLVY